MRLKNAACVMGICFLSIAYPQISYAGDVFKSADFLKWEANSRDFYVRTSVGMTSLVVGQSNKQHSKCIDNWYFSNEKAGNKFVYDTMKSYPEYHPRGIILGVLQKKCGEFKYD